MGLNGTDVFDLLNFSTLFNDIAFHFISTTTKPIEYVSVTNTSVRTFADNPIEWRLMVPPYLAIFLLSIIGNSFVIITLISNGKIKTVTNIYLLNLAISDILLGVFCMPFTLIGQIYRRFLFGAAMCKIIPFFQAVAVSVDVWTLVAISLERYFAICRPLKSRRWQTQFHAYKMIATVWIMSFFLNSPILYVSTLQPMNDYAFKCREDWPTLELERAFNIGLDVALLLIPFLIMLIAHSLIGKKLWRRMRHEIKQNYNWQRGASRQTSCKSCRLLIQMTPNIQHSLTEFSEKTEHWSFRIKNEDMVRLDTDTSSNQSDCIHTAIEPDFRLAVRSTHILKSIKAKRKVIRMLFVIILIFFICWTPLHLINTIYLFYPDELMEIIGMKGIMLLQLLAFCSSCCNPITYSFMNKKFRLAFVNLLRNCGLLRKCMSSPESESQRQTTPQPSSQDMTTRIARGSQTGRTDLEAQDGDESFEQRLSRRASRLARRPVETGSRHSQRNFTFDSHTDHRDRRRRQPVPVSYHVDADGRTTTATASL